MMISCGIFFSLIFSLNPFRGNLRTPYKLDASNYQPQEARKLMRHAKNQVEQLFVSMATRDLQLSQANDLNEKIIILEEHSSQTMNSLSICLDLLCEEQIYAWKWRSRCKALGRQLEEIRNLFSRVNLEASRMIRKEQRLVLGPIYKEYVRSGTIKTPPSAPKTPTTPNVESSRISRIESIPGRSNPRNLSARSNHSECSRSSAVISRPLTSATIQSMHENSKSSIISFPELEVGYIPS
jgi:hypothetical protein